MHQLTQLIEHMALSQPAIKRLWIAYSGGVDSTVLLHAALPLADRWAVGVIHVNHQISPNADAWQKHCEKVTAAWGVTQCVSERVTVQYNGSGLEQAAREARYAVFSRHLQEGDLLLMAHHLSDQSETFFLRLIRGAGLRGLGGMPTLRTFSAGHLARPFLNVSKQDLLTYAKHHQLSWVEDDSNQATVFDRNFLRLEVLPRLRGRWLHFDARVASAIERLRQASALLNEYLDADLKLLDPRTERLGSSLAADRLNEFSTEKTLTLLRRWIETLGFRSPSQEHSRELLNVLTAKLDASPVVTFGDCEVRRYKNRMYCLRDGWQEQITFTAKSIRHFTSAVTDHLGVCLTFNRDKLGVILRPDDICQPLQTYSGSRRAHPHFRTHSQTLKKLFQECQVEPWLRPHWPVIVRDGELICAPGLWVEKRYLAHEKDAVFPDWCMAAASDGT